MRKIAIIILAAWLLAPLAAVHAAGVAILRCEYRENSLGVDVAKPRLSIKSERRGERQGVLDKAADAQMFAVSNAAFVAERGRL